jgi:hypothetical protein
MWDCAVPSEIIAARSSFVSHRRREQINHILAFGIQNLKVRLLGWAAVFGTS